MEQIPEFVDERQKSWCIHCGRWIASLETARDHVPTKGLLVNPYPPNLPVVQICKPCNSSFSLDEEYFIAVLGSVLSGSTDPARQTHANASRVLGRNEKLRARIEKSKSHQQTKGGELQLVWRPELDRIKRIILKNARGHAFYEIGEPMLAQPEHVWSAPLESLSAEQRADFENANDAPLWPEVGSRMLTRVLTGQGLVDGWVPVQDGVYRYAVIQTGGMLVRTVLFEYLATEVCWES